MREATLTVSPNRQYLNRFFNRIIFFFEEFCFYLGIFKPTTPATHGPKYNPKAK